MAQAAELHVLLPGPAAAPFSALDPTQILYPSILPSKLVRASFQVWNMLPPEAQEVYQALYLLNSGRYEM